MSREGLLLLWYIYSHGRDPVSHRQDQKSETVLFMIFYLFSAER